MSDRFVLLLVVLAIATASATLPVPFDPKVETLPLSSDTVIAHALTVINSRLARGRTGSSVGFNLVTSFINKKATKVARKIEDFKAAIDLYNKHISHLEDVILTSKRDLNDVRQSLTEVKQSILAENVNPRALFQAAQVIDRHQKVLVDAGAISLLEIEELKAAAIPDDHTDAMLQKLKETEQKSDEAAKSADKAVDKAIRKLKDAKETRHIARLKHFESTKSKLEYLSGVLTSRISVSESGIVKTKQNIVVVKDAVKRHYFIGKVVNKLNTDISVAQGFKQKVYDRQIASVSSVAQAFKLGLDLSAFKIDDGTAPVDDGTAPVRQRRRL